MDYVKVTEMNHLADPWRSNHRIPHHLQHGEELQVKVLFEVGLWEDHEEWTHENPMMLIAVRIPPFLTIRQTSIMTQDIEDNLNRNYQKAKRIGYYVKHEGSNQWKLELRQPGGIFV